MIRILAILVLACGPVFAQSDSPTAVPRRTTRVAAADEVIAPSSVEGAPDRPSQPQSRVPAVESVHQPRRGSLTNYRILLEIEQEGGPSQRMSIVMAEGGAELNTVDPNSVQIEDYPVPSTVTLSVTLKETEDSRCELKLVFGRTIPYVSGTVGGPPGQTRSMVQQMRVGLNTSLILASGQSIVVQDSGRERITLTLNRVE